MERCIFRDGKFGKCSLSSTKPKDVPTEVCNMAYSVASHGSNLKIDLEGTTEVELIMNRARQISYKDDDIICPKHRLQLGIYWKPGKACQHPNHPSNKKVKSSSLRSGTVSICNQLDIPIGSPICTSCRKDPHQCKKVLKTPEHQLRPKPKQTSTPVNESVHDIDDIPLAISISAMGSNSDVDSDISDLDASYRFEASDSLNDILPVINSNLTPVKSQGIMPLEQMGDRRRNALINKYKKCALQCYSFV